MSELQDKIAKQMERGLLDAGFARVEVMWEEPIRGSVRICCARAFCPCGEPSTFAYAFNRLHDRDPEGMYHRAYYAGKKHIEKDKAEGRWHTPHEEGGDQRK
jgi:hypothetical protein